MLIQINDFHYPNLYANDNVYFDSDSVKRKRFYLFINYNTITNYILIIYELNKFYHLLGVVSQTRVSGGNRTHDPYTNSLAHYPLDYQGTQA